MNCVVWDEDQWVRCLYWAFYRYIPGGLMVLVVALERIRAVENRGRLRPFS